ncbi:DUF4157 domain-containing protein [Nitrospira sp. NS4]|uniref:eCIS core domain-containing protein n=1 Tax=Nitrospira sp. NS4 TaxID=3414498 RepID=UPI003C2D626A
MSLGFESRERACGCQRGGTVVPPPRTGNGTALSLAQRAGRLPLFLQAKLAISQPKDPAEVEADRVADHVMRRPEPAVQQKSSACAAGGRSCPVREKEQPGMVSRKAQGDRLGDAPASVHSVIRSPGQPLGSDACAFFEPRFGREFGHVRVHADGEAQQSARAVNALAYTVGSHVVFGRGVPNIGQAAGRALWAHELAHTVQQGPEGDRLQPLSVGPSGDVLEREADAAALSVISGRSAQVRAGSARTGTRRLQRVEYGTYISTLTDPPLKIFLDNAEVYYRGWGYPNVKRISTVDEVLKDLEKAKNHIDTFRIVTHAGPGHLQVGLTSAISTEEVSQEEMGMTTAQSFRPLLTKNKVVSNAAFAREMGLLRADATTGALLTRIGVPATNPGDATPLGILLRAILDADLVSSATLDDGSKLVLKNKAVLDLWNSQRIREYRAVVEDAAAPAQQAAVKQAITDLIAAAPGVLRAGGIDWSFNQTQADTIGSDLLDPNKQPATLKPELGAAITEGAGKGTFVPRLARVRTHIDANTHIEIRGCNAGSDKKFLNSVRSFFGPAGNLPSISAPDLFQAFFKLGFESYNLSVPADQKRLQDTWDDPTSGMAAAFDDAHRTRNGEMIRVVSDTKLSDLRSRYGLSQTVQELTDLNPELKPDAIHAGDVVWLVGHQLPAGQSTNLEDFCERVLGNKYLWPKIWSYNDHWSKPPVLKPTDMVWVVSAAMRKRVASATRSLADLQADLQQGNAFGMKTPTNQFKLHVDHTQRAASVGSWLEKQGYDFKGRSAADLSKIFAGDFQKKFSPAMSGHGGQFLTRGFPDVEDPIFPDDPRYAGHIIRQP